jgi:hypothetical protein
LLWLDNEVEKINQYKVGSKYEDSIKEDLFPPGTVDYGKSKLMKKEYLVAFRIFIASFVIRDGGTDTISWAHKHFIWFMLKRVKINLADTLFEHLCFCITESHHKSKVVIHHPKLISELLRQTKLIEALRSREKLRVFNTMKFDGHNLVNIKMIKAKNLIYPMNPLKKIYEEYFWCNGFPTISEFDNDEVIEDFLEDVRKDTGYPVDRSMVAGVPDWDLINNLNEKQRLRAGRVKNVKKILFEETVETTKAGNGEHDNYNGNDSVNEMVDDSKNQGGGNAENKADGTYERQEVDNTEKNNAGNVENERRSKKRNERPSSSEESRMPLTTRLVKKLKTVASRPSKKAANTPKGKVSEPNVASTPEAQHIHPPNPTIDVTKPLSMILPDPQPQIVNISLSSSSSSDSSSENTLSDSSHDTISVLIRKGPKPKTKTPVV